MLFRQAHVRRRRHYKLRFIDVRKAHLNGVCEEDVYDELPVEANAGPGMCGKLERWLYGMRLAGQAWEREYSVKLESIGLKKGKAAATAFWNKDTEVRAVVHGDDFTLLGPEDELKKGRGKDGGVVRHQSERYGWWRPE